MPKGVYKRTKKVTEKTKAILSEARKKDWKNPKIREKQVKAHKDWWKNLAKDKKEKILDRVSKFAEQNWQDPKYRAKMLEVNSRTAKKQWQDPEYRKEKSRLMQEQRRIWGNDPKYQEMQKEKGSRILKKLWESEDFRKMMSERSKALWRNEDFRNRMIKILKEKIPWNLGLTNETDERVRRVSELNKGRIPWNKWKHWTKEQMKKCFTRHIPSSLEEKFLSIVNKFHLPYRYTGNGSFVINHCNPDFINTNSEKIAIEVYARYYKQRDGRNILRWKHIRRQKFLKFGWRIVFFDETQVNEKFVLATLGGE